MKLYARMYTGQMTFLSLCLYPRLYSETFGHGLGFSLSSSYGMTDQKLLKSLKRLLSLLELRSSEPGLVIELKLMSRKLT